MSWPIGRKPTSEHRAKLAEALRGNRNNPGSPWKGQRRPEVALKVSQTLTGHAVTPETRAKLSVALKGNQSALGHRVSEQGRARMSAGRKAGVAARVAAKRPACGPDLIIGECVYCGGPAGTWDHMIPRIRGGSDDSENLVPACRSCNSSKGDLTPEEWISR